MDASALVALFGGHARARRLLDEAERGQINLLLPTAAIADAEHELHAGFGGWEGVLLSGGLRSMPLAEHAAIEMGAWPGSLAARHAAHEAQALPAAVVTADPGAYKGIPVVLRVI
jgi:hypothetical protein